MMLRGGTAQDIRALLPGVLLTAALALLAVALPALGASRYVLTLIYYLAYNIVLGQSWNMMSGMTGYVSFAHGALAGLGAYAAVVAMNAGWPIPAALPAGSLVAVAGSSVVGASSLRLRGVAFTFATLFFQQLALLILRKLPASGGAGGLALQDILPVALPQMLMVGLAALATIAVLALRRSRTGIRLLAIREDEVAAASLGIGVTRLKLAVFCASATIAGAGGAVHGLFTVSLYPDDVFSVDVSLTALAAPLAPDAASRGAGVAAGRVAMTLLDLRDVAKRFGGVQAVGGVSLAVGEGELVGLFGPNGAGKTTLFNLIAGSFAPDSGSMRFDGRDVTRLPGWRRARLGIARTFQVTRPFRDLTVRENVLVAVPRAGTPREVGADRLLAQVGLEGRAGDKAGARPGGAPWPGDRGRGDGAEGRARRVGRAGRPERGRADVAAARCHGTCAPSRPNLAGRRGDRSPAALGAAAARDRLRAGRPAAVRSDDGRGEPACRRAWRRGARAGRQPGWHLRHVPAPCRTTRPAGRHALRRRAADAGPRPRADGSPATPADRRDFLGADATAGRARVRASRRAARERRHHPAGGAEHARSAAPCAACVRDVRRTDRNRRSGAGRGAGPTRTGVLRWPNREECACRSCRHRSWRRSAPASSGCASASTTHIGLPATSTPYFRMRSTPPWRNRDGSESRCRKPTAARVSASPRRR